MENLTPEWSIPGNLQTDKYILPVSGGGDSSALAILLHEQFPHVPFELVFSDTGAEEEDAYESLKKLEAHLGKTITWINPKKNLFELIEHYGGFLPSAQQRWCTRELKLIPFQNWLKTHQGVQKWMFVGIRADESSRVAFTIDECETVMPFVELGIKRDDVFKILSRTIGVPKTYQTRTRSGCGVCPFQRRSELVGLLQRSPAEYQRGAQCEKIAPVDQERHPIPPSLASESGVAGNWMSFPIPKGNMVGARGRDLSLFQKTGFFVGVEFFYDGFLSNTEFIWHQRLVSFSRALSGIKKQLQGRYNHLLQTSEVYGMSPEEVRAKVKFAIYFVEAPADVLDTKTLSQESYTWHSGESYQQIRHLVSWATRMLHAQGLADVAGQKMKVPETSWLHENASISEKALKSVKSELGAVISSQWFKPEEPVEEEDIEEKFFPCPMCQI